MTPMREVRALLERHRRKALGQVSEIPTVEMLTRAFDAIAEEHAQLADAILAIDAALERRWADSGLTGELRARMRAIRGVEPET